MRRASALINRGGLGSFSRFSSTFPANTVGIQAVISAATTFAISKRTRLLRLLGLLCFIIIHPSAHSPTHFLERGHVFSPDQSLFGVTAHEKKRGDKNIESRAERLSFVAANEGFVTEVMGPEHRCSI